MRGAKARKILRSRRVYHLTFFVSSRVIGQTANDNANDLIQELTLQYNKTRQQAITNELLDIMGGQ